MMDLVKLYSKYGFAVILAISAIAVLSFNNHTPALLILISYGFGSFPSGLILTKFFVNQDIRQIGSGNIGATNVLRTGNKGIAIATLVLDALKAVIPILWLKTYVTTDIMTYAIALAAILGHLFPIWLNFKGGKGVATALGIFVALNWMLAVIALSLWIVFLFAFKYSSLAALLTVTAISPISYFIVGKEMAIFTLILALLIILKHHGNIRRLLQGKEPKIGQR